MLFYQILIQASISLITALIKRKRHKEELPISSKIIYSTLTDMRNFFYNQKNQKFLIYCYFYSFLYVINAGIGMKALSLIPIPIFLTIRRTLILFVLIVTRFLGVKKEINSTTVVAILLITTGAIFSSINNIINLEPGDTQVAMQGYLLVGVSNISTALLLEYSNYLNVKEKI